MASLQFATPSAATLGVTAGEINVPVKFHVRLDTIREQSEWATDFIRRGRPVVIEFAINGGDTAETVATKLAAAFDAYAKKFIMSDSGLPFTYVRSTANFTLTAKAGHLSFRTKMEFIPGKRGTSRSSFGYPVEGSILASAGVSTHASAGNTATQITLAAAAGDAIQLGDVVVVDSTEYKVTGISTDSLVLTVEGDGTTAPYDTAVSVKLYGAEALGSGQELEENVRMGTPANSLPYGIKAADAVDVTGSYAKISWKAAVASAEGGWQAHSDLAGKIAAGAQAGDRTALFTLYFNEATLASNGAKELVDFLISATAVSASDFKKSNGAVSTDGADFIG